jgi:hypothetical protein
VEPQVQTPVPPKKKKEREKVKPNKKWLLELAWWCMHVIPATQEVEAEGFSV